MKSSKFALIVSACAMSLALSACKTGVRLSSPEDTARTAGYAILKGETDILAKTLTKDLAAKYATPEGIAALRAKVGDYKKLRMPQGLQTYSEVGALGYGQYGIKKEKWEQPLYGVTKGQPDHKIAVLNIYCERHAYEYTIPGDDCTTDDLGGGDEFPHHSNCIPSPDTTGIAVARVCQITSLNLK